MRQISLFIIFMMVANLVIAQNDHCSTIFSADQKKVLLSNKMKNNYSSPRNDELIYIPIKFHLVADAEGNGRATFPLVMDQLCELNNIFEPIGYKFYLKDGSVNEINNNTVFNNPASSAGQVKMATEKNNFGQNALNIFLTKNADTGGLGQTLGFYTFNQDWVVIRNNILQSTMQRRFVLAHEIGHYFSLAHTFNGWDQEPWDGTPVTSNTSPGGELNELVDGSNCEEAGDMICDTPADYNLGFGWDGCRDYDGGCQDITGALLDPDEQNFMGYFIGCENYFFSEEQIQIINNDYLTARRAHIRVSYQPNDTEILDRPINVSPPDDASLDNFNGIELEWTPVENATHYYIELSRGLFKESFIVENNNKVFLTNLNPNSLYRWFVIPFNEIYTCGQASAVSSFRTGSQTTSTSEVEEFGDFLEVFPNPIIDGNMAIHAKNDYLGGVGIKIFNPSGIQLFLHQVEKNEQTLNHTITNLKLPAGFYILSINFGNSIVTKKVIINE